MSDENRTEPTPEEIAEYRKRMDAFYDAEIPLLEKKLKYETLLASIEEQKVKTFTNMIRFAQMATPPSERKTEDPKEPSKSE